MSSINIPTPWWKVSLPDWVPEIGAPEYYALVATIRHEPFGHRMDACARIDNLDLLIKYCIWAESVGLEKDIAGKVVRLFKLVKSYDHFQTRVPEQYAPRAHTLAFLQELGDSAVDFEAVRTAMVPKKVSVLSEDQKAGLGRLQVFEKERGRINAEYDNQERILMAQLRKLRTDKDTFNAELKTIVPEWKEVLDARKARLTMREKQEALEIYEASPSYKDQFTHEAFLLTVRQNKISNTEHELYRRFRSGMSESFIRESVARAIPQAHQEPIRQENHHTLDPGFLPEV